MGTREMAALVHLDPKVAAAVAAGGSAGEAVLGLGWTLVSPSHNKACVQRYRRVSKRMAHILWAYTMREWVIGQLLTNWKRGWLLILS